MNFKVSQDVIRGLHDALRWELVAEGRGSSEPTGRRGAHTTHTPPRRGLRRLRGLDGEGWSESKGATQNVGQGVRGGCVCE